MHDPYKELVGFVVEKDFSDLPTHVITEVKRALLDSIGCAIAGTQTEAGKIAVELATRLGGPTEATILGTGSRVSVTNAAFANGQLINALDMDVLGLDGHSPPFVIAAALAMAESLSVSGKELITAIALGQEVASRLSAAMLRSPKMIQHVMQIVEANRDTEESIVGQIGVMGSATACIGAGVAAGKILGLSFAQMIHAIGIAAYSCIPNTLLKFFNTSPVNMTKYGLIGMGAQSGITSALLAQAGFTGDDQVFETPFGFHRFVGMFDFDASLLTQGLGQVWHSGQLVYKSLPTGLCTAFGVSLFMEIIEENQLQPEEIERVILKTTPWIQFAAFRNNGLRSSEDFFFNARYSLACAIHRIDPSRWHSPETRSDPRIMDFVRRVDYHGDYDELEYLAAVSGDALEAPSSAEVLARGKTFVKSTGCEGGLCRPKSRLGDDQIFDKFMKNSRSALFSDQQERIGQTVWGLERLPHLTDLAQLFEKKKSKQKQRVNE